MAELRGGVYRVYVFGWTTGQCIMVMRPTVLISLPAEDRGGEPTT